MPAPTDFDHLIGSHAVVHRRLRSRLDGCTEWDEFPGACTNVSVLGGFGVIEDNLIELPAGSYRALGIRSYDPGAAHWAIWWLDGRAPHALDVPVVGAFDADGVGTFVAHDELDGRPIAVRFTWSGITATHAHWEQAFSADDGTTWETNWTMDFTKLAAET